jgi:hypothetical protein
VHLSKVFPERRAPKEANGYPAGPASLAAFKCGKGLVLQWSIEVVRYFDLSFQQSQAFFANGRRDGGKSRHRLARFGNNDLRPAATSLTRRERWVFASIGQSRHWTDGLSRRGSRVRVPVRSAKLSLYQSITQAENDRHSAVAPLSLSCAVRASLFNDLRRIFRS